MVLSRRGIEAFSPDDLRLAVMLHAFRVLDLAQIYASILPANTVSLRLFARLGYLPDDSPVARAFADEPDDVALAVTRARFESTAAARSRT